MTCYVECKLDSFAQYRKLYYHILSSRFLIVLHKQYVEGFEFFLFSLSTIEDGI